MSLESQNTGLPKLEHRNKLFDKKANHWTLAALSLDFKKGQLLSKISRPTVKKGQIYKIWPRKGKPGNPGPLDPAAASSSHGA